MVKSGRNQIDQDEEKVLFELVKNANENVGTIAKHSGVSRQKVSNIIKHLEENHLIWGYTAIFDEEKIGLTHFILMIKRTIKKLGVTTADKIILRKIEDLAEKLGITIESSFYIHGEYDWVVTFTSVDIKHGQMIYDSLITLYPHVIKKITIMQTLMFIRKQYILNPDKKKLKDFL